MQSIAKWGPLQKANEMAKTSLTTAVEAAKNFTDAQASANNLAEQLRMAGLVQRDFLPTHLPNCDQLRWATIFASASFTVVPFEAMLQTASFSSDVKSIMVSPFVFLLKKDPPGTSETGLL